MPNGQRPLLSIGMIVKNEERCIARCLKSLQPLRQRIPVQIVVADTGSTDRTKEIAAQYADELFDFPWVNDFSAARNAGMDRCTGIWFMALDADEWFEDEFDQLVDFLQSDSAQYTGAALVCRNHHGVKQEGDYSEFLAPRLIRMDMGTRYHGVVHETPIHPDGCDIEAFPLDQTIMHHDGYMLSPEAREAKSRRNLALLRQAIKGEPNSLLRMVQQIESSGATKYESMLKIARRGIALFHDGTATKVAVAPSLYGYGVLAACYLKKYSLLYQWIAEMESLFPTSIHTRLDAQAFGLWGASTNGEDEKAVEFGRKWLEGLAAYNGGGEVRYELSKGQVLTVATPIRTSFHAIFCQALCRTEHWDEAEQQFEQLNFSYLEQNNWVTLTQLLFRHAEDLPDVQPLLQRLWDTAQQQSEDDPEWRAKKNYVLGAMNRQYDALKANGQVLGIHHILAELRNCTPGCCARCLLAEDAATAEQELDGITAWEEAFPAALVHAMDLGARLPDSFYARPTEQMEQDALRVGAHCERFPDIALRWETAVGRPETALERLWHFDLLAVAMQRLHWDKGTLCEELIGSFMNLSKAMLDHFYNPELLNESNILIIPGLQRFGWYLVKARDDEQAGDLAGAAHALRSALKASPAMKHVVEYSLRQMQLRAVGDASPELLALATQVREMIAAMRERGDPGVDELMASPAYQKLKPIIEGIELTAPLGLLQ